MTNDIIAKSLNMKPMVKKQEFTVITPNNDNSEQQEADLEYAREQILELSKIGQEAVKTYSQVANSTQTSKDFDALSKILKTTLDAHKDLIQVHKDRKELEKDTNKPQTVHNNLYVGSTVDMLDMIDKEEKDENL